MNVSELRIPTILCLTSVSKTAPWIKRVHLFLDGHLVCDWRSKYTKLPGIRSLHDFLFIKNTIVVAKVRKTCFSGRYENTTMHIATGRQVTENIIPNPDNESYHALQKIKVLSETKRKHLQQMYNDLLYCLELTML